MDKQKRRRKWKITKENGVFLTIPRNADEDLCVCVCGRMDEAICGKQRDDSVQAIFLVVFRDERPAYV